MPQQPSLADLALLKQFMGSSSASADDDPWAAPPTEAERMGAAPRAAEPRSGLYNPMNPSPPVTQLDIQRAIRGEGPPRTTDINLPPDPRRPLDTNRLPETGGMPGGDADPSGRLALARLLGVDSGSPDDSLPGGGAPPPSPRSITANDPRISAAILTGGGMRANDPQALARARQNEADDLFARVNREGPVAGNVVESFVPGEPGRRQLSRPYLSQYLEDRGNLGRVEGDMAADPYTGVAEQARVAGIKGKLDDAAMTLRPETADVAKTLAERNAFAKFLEQHGITLGTKKAELEAAASPEAYAAGIMKERIAGSSEAQDNARRALTLPIDVQGSPEAQRLKDLDVEREGIKKMQPSLAPGMFPTASGEAGDITDPRTGMSYALPPNLKPLSAADQGAVKAFGLAAPMLGDLKKMLDPNKNQITNSIAQHGKWALYQLGVSPDVYMSKDDPKEQARLQLASMIKIIAGSPYLNGSRNFKFIQQIQNHLTNPVATDKFLYNQIQELEQRWPEMLNEIMRRHVTPGAPLDFHDEWTPPSYADIQKSQGR